MMKTDFFRGNPDLETPRLILRRLTEADAEDIFAYGSDDEVTRYMIWDTHRSIEDARWFINFTKDRYDKDEAGEWGIILKNSGQLIGCIGFPWHDRKNLRAELGYVLARSYWGQGIMPEAAGAVLDFVFGVVGLNRIECCHFEPNEKSGRVMQKCGMHFEGTARERIYAKACYWDVRQYAILRGDWLAAKGEA